MINNETARITYYTVADQTTVYAITFMYDKDPATGEPELEVTLDGVVLTWGTDYVVNASGLQLTSAPEVGHVLKIVRNVPLTQEQDYQTGLIRSEDIEHGFDRSVMRDQMLSEQVTEVSEGLADLDASLADVAKSGDYNDLINQPTIGAGVVTITQDGVTKGTFTTNQSGNTTIDLDAASFPDQTGHAGELLTTNGSDVSWSDRCYITEDVFRVRLGSSTSYLATSGISIGDDARTGRQPHDISIGDSAGSTTSNGTNISLGYSVWAGDGKSFGIIIGSEGNVRADYGIAIGHNLSVTGLNAIQLGAPGTGTATNPDANTFKVANASGNYEIMSADGTIPEARLADTTNAQQGDVLTLDSNGNAVWQAGGSGLPAQTGNAGKFLTTDGTDASWSDKPLVNTATGTNSLTIGSSIAGMFKSAINIGGISQAYNYSVAIGYSSIAATSGVAIGYDARISGDFGVAVGRGANVGADRAIQIGSGMNQDTNTFKVSNANGNFEMMSADGTIPAARHAALPVADGTYTLQLVITNGEPTLSWVAV